VPPKKVIKALYDYEAQGSQELSFSRGDFFHVIGRENDSDWYEACNPALPDARGLVPVAFFQALGRTERDSGHSDGGRPIGAKNPDQDSGYGDATPMTSPLPARMSKAGPGAGAAGALGGIGKSNAMVYGIVMYDFKAERADELEAKAGEAIIVIAQSNPEWFVAKPIGRLGGPGLIPVSFIEIRDMVTGKAVEDPGAAIRAAGVPKVEEWKKLVAIYKESSITLGKFEQPQQQQSLEQGMDRLSVQPQPRQQVMSPHSNTFPQPSPQGSQRAQPSPQPSPLPYSPQISQPMPAPVRARIPRYCFADDKYWFVIEAELEDGRHWELSRYYEDFYDFQIHLLTEFPVEAGNADKDKKRTLPYMPGPVSYVTDAITEGRLHNLDAYVKNLLAQPTYISKCNLVRQFFAPREGDYEIDPNSAEDYRWSGGSAHSGAESQEAQPNNNNNALGNGYPSMAGSRRPSVQPTISGQPGATKIKLWFNGEFIAIRVPSDIMFQALWEKIRDRLKISSQEDIALMYKDESTGDKLSLMNDNDLNVAMSRNEKLVLYVEIV
jgi:bud emergence protein 1